MEEKRGTISDIIYYNKENCYVIAVAENEEEQFTIVGYLPSAERGRAFIFNGSWKTHAVYGEQFSFTEYKEEMPSTHEGIEGFLSSGILKGIGKKTAASIVRKFGSDTFEIIQNSPRRLTEIDGIGDKKALSISEAFRAHRELAEVTLFFQQFGITAVYALKLYKVYGDYTHKTCQKRSYQLGV